MEFAGLRFSFRLCTFENVYGLDRERMKVEDKGDEVKIQCSQFVWAKGQGKAPGRVTARFQIKGSYTAWNVQAEMTQPIKSLTCIVRGVPRGSISVSGEAFFDPREDEVLFGYPFADGDFSKARVMRTPLAVVKHGEQSHLYLSMRDDKVRANRSFFQPGEKGYRVELIFETGGWARAHAVKSPTWLVGESASMNVACRPHYEHLESTFRPPAWEERQDMPAWARDTALVVFLWGVHWTGSIFNDYARMTRILE